MIFYCLIYNTIVYGNYANEEQCGPEAGPCKEG